MFSERLGRWIKVGVQLHVICIKMVRKTVLPHDSSNWNGVYAKRYRANNRSLRQSVVERRLR